MFGVYKRALQQQVSVELFLAGECCFEALDIKMFL